MALFGLGAQKPHHYVEMLKVGWENRDSCRSPGGS